MSPRTIVEDRYASIEELCDALVAEFWQRRPCVFRNPFGPDLFGGSGDVIDGLRERRRRGQPWPVYTDLRRGPMPDDERHWYGPEDASLRDYVDRLLSAHGARHVTFVVSGLQAASEQIWFRSARFLNALYPRVGLPWNEAKMFLFAGKYGPTPFGLHKDTDISITCIIEGRKRYLIWPYDALARRLGMPASGRYLDKQLPEFDYQTVRSAAIEFEAEPGDIVYWPWDAWHVIEADGQFCVSLQIGAIPFSSPISWVDEATRDTARELGSTRFTPGEQSDDELDPMAGIRRVLADETVLDDLREKLLHRRTRYGFSAAIPPSDGATFAAGDRLVPPIAGVIAWLERPGKLLISANGNGFSTEPDPRVIELLGELNLGHPIRVADLEQRYCAGRGLDRGQLHAVLDRLLRIRAFDRAAPQPG